MTQKPIKHLAPKQRAWFGLQSQQYKEFGDRSVACPCGGSWQSGAGELSAVPLGQGGTRLRHAFLSPANTTSDISLPGHPTQPRAAQTCPIRNGCFGIVAQICGSEAKSSGGNETKGFAAWFVNPYPNFLRLFCFFFLNISLFCVGKRIVKNLLGKKCMVFVL